MESPLTEATSTSIDELFSRDPLDLSDRDIAQIVDTFKKKRLLWEQEETTAQREGRRTRTPKQPKEAAKNISLDNLNIKL